MKLPISDTEDVLTGMESRGVHPKCAVVIVSTMDRPIAWLEQALKSCAGWPVYLIRDRERRGKAWCLARWWMRQDRPPSLLGVLDDDDYLNVGALVNFEKLMDLYPEKSFACSDYIEVTTAGNRRQNNATSRTFALTRGDLNRCQMFFCPGFKVYRRTALEHVGGFNPTVQAVEDIELCTRLVLGAGPGLQVEGRWWCYRKHSGSQRSIREKSVVLQRYVREVITHVKGHPVSPSASVWEEARKDP